MECVSDFCSSAAGYPTGSSWRMGARLSGDKDAGRRQGGRGEHVQRTFAGSATTLFRLPAYRDVLGCRGPQPTFRHTCEWAKPGLRARCLGVEQMVSTTPRPRTGCTAL